MSDTWRIAARRWLTNLTLCAISFPALSKTIRGRLIPYPLRATKISLEINLFGFWAVPRFVYHRSLTEAAKADGATIWYARWAWFQISFGRWV